MVELLAPVGSWEALVAAVESGAQAVYLGGKMFGARHYAPNFDEEEMRSAVRYAHLRGVAVHVTVNILIDTGELEELADYLRMLYDVGVDAIIVQDLAVARIAKEVVPHLALHGSTQMTVHNLAGVEFLASNGFSRVVLSREVSLEDIRHICKHSPVEIETFIHGALCVCYSGQCLMSSLIGGRSGNRGKCAQPCRLPYELVDANGQNVLAGKDAGEYLLSPKDLNTLELLPELIDAGVASFKIEGRMKRPEYVAVVVDTYRRAIDSVIAGQNYSAGEEEQRELAQVFNRDFTTAYLKKKLGRTMMSDRRPNNRGTRAGRVVEYDRSQQEALIQLDERLTMGDVLDVWVKVGGRVNVTVDKIILDGQAVEAAPAKSLVTINMPATVRSSDRIFKTFDVKLMERARAFFAKPEALPKKALYGTVRAAVGEPLKIMLTDEDGYSGEAVTNFIGQAARNRPLTEETIFKQVERLGNTMFSLQELTCDIQGEVMVPVSEINEARRKAIEALEQERLNVFQREPLAAAVKSVPSLYLPAQPSKKKIPILTVNVDRVAKVKAALAGGADHILFGGECYGHQGLTADDYRSAINLVREAGKKITFNTPRIIKEWQIAAFKAQLFLFDDLAPDAVAVNNLGTVELLRSHKFSLMADYGLNVFNKLSLDFWQSQGIEVVTLSPELSFSQIEKLARQKATAIECLVYGPLEMMVSEYCVIGSFLGGLGKEQCRQACLNGKYYLKDRMNALFPVETDQFCRMHVLNSKELSMLPHLPQFTFAGVDRVRLEAKTLAPDAIEKVTKLYRQVLDQGESHPAFLNGQIESLEPKEFTRGHYFRGVL